MDETKLISEKCVFEDVLSAFGDLSEELELFGVPALPEIQISKQSELNANELSVLLKSLINASYYMLNRHRKLLREYEEIELKRMRDIDDNHALKATVERLRRELGEKDRALLKNDEEIRSLKLKVSKKEQELKTQIEEIRTVKCQLKYNEKKTAHDMRKKDVQINKLQVQLERAIGNRPVSKNKGTAINKDAKISKDFTDNEETYQQIICKFEASNKGLLIENQVMNKALLKLNGDLASLVDNFNEVLELQQNHASENKIVDKEEEVTIQRKVISHNNVSLEECMTSSNEYVESLNTLLDCIKGKCFQ